MRKELSKMLREANWRSMHPQLHAKGNDQVMSQVITWKPSTSLANNYLFTQEQVSMSRFKNIVRLGFQVI